MKLIGTIQQVQIQREPLKKGEKSPERFYDPAPIMVVDGLKLTKRGAFGLTADGDAIIDAHHMDHPQTRNRKNANGISFGFTNSYDRMQTNYGDHLAVGIAGENIIIKQADDFNMAELGTKLMIKSNDAEIILEEVMVAPPCREFSCFVYGKVIDGETLRETLQYLSDGTRGFYATLCLKQDGEPIIQAGDEVFMI